MDLLDRVRRTVRAHDLARADTRVLVALSGGSDSVALAYLLAELAGRGELVVAGVVHLNHQLRPAAGGDEAFCAATGGAAWLAVSRPIARTSRRVPGPERRSVEDAARAARYEFFEQARVRLEADAIALGHTRDDQAETFLLRLVRGAGSRGLAGMHPRRGRIIRPLLDCRRGDLRAFLEARGVTFVHDESNDDVSIPRNRVRAELLPFLERRFNPSIVDVLADEAELAREEWEWMEQAAREAGRGSRVAGRTLAPGCWTWRRFGSCRRRWRASRFAMPLVQAADGRAVVVPARGRGVTPRRLAFAARGGGPIERSRRAMERRGQTLVLTSRGPAAPARSSEPFQIFAVYSR